MHLAGRKSKLDFTILNVLYGKQNLGFLFVGKKIRNFSLNHTKDKKEYSF